MVEVLSPKPVVAEESSYHSNPGVAELCEILNLSPLNIVVINVEELYPTQSVDIGQVHNAEN